MFVSDGLIVEVLYASIISLYSYRVHLIRVRLGDLFGVGSQKASLRYILGVVLPWYLVLGRVCSNSILFDSRLGPRWRPRPLFIRATTDAA